MGRPYSTDLRERVLRACEVGTESQATIARRFEISESAVLRSLVAAKNDATLAEYTRAFVAQTGEEISESSVCRALQRHGLVIKKSLCGRVSNGGRTLPLNAMTSTRRLRRSIRTAWSFWTRVGS
jgi:transposase